MGSHSLYAACIQRAALLLGGYDTLAARVNVPPDVLERWAYSGGLGAKLVFLKVVDILVEEAMRQPPTPTRWSPEVSTRYRR